MIAACLESFPKITSSHAIIDLIRQRWVSLQNYIHMLKKHDIISWSDSTFISDFYWGHRTIRKNRWIRRSGAQRNWLFCLHRSAYTHCIRPVWPYKPYTVSKWSDGSYALILEVHVTRDVFSFISALNFSQSGWYDYKYRYLPHINSIKNEYRLGKTLQFLCS